MRSSAKIAKFFIHPRVQVGAAAFLMGSVTASAVIASRKDQSFDMQLAEVTKNIKQREINSIPTVTAFINHFEKIHHRDEFTQFWQWVSPQQLHAYVKDPKDCAKLYLSLMTHMERIYSRNRFDNMEFIQVLALRDLVLNDFFAGIVSHISNIHDVNFYQEILTGFKCASPSDMPARIANINAPLRLLEYLVKHNDIAALFPSPKDMFLYLRNASANQLSLDLVLHNAETAKAMLLKADNFVDIRLVLDKCREHYRSEVSATILSQLNTPYFANLAKGIKDESDLYYLLSYLDAHQDSPNAGLQQQAVIAALADHPVVRKLQEYSIQKLLIKGYSSESVAYLVQDDKPVNRLSVRC